jgi:V/A-type H+-transporting ATPase subunit D
MMLLRLRRRLELARRGHRLLKNKQEKLMQSFIALVRETVELRDKVEKIFLSIGGHYIRGRALTDRQSLVDALDMTTRAGTLSIDMRYEMNLQIPKLTFTIPDTELSYKLTTTSPELDYAFEKLFTHFPDLLDLAEKENALYLMSDELEKTRRRVNALEYVLIPDLEETIRGIESKLSEDERSTQTRLMKVKEMVERRGNVAR